MRIERPGDPLACASYIRCQEQSEGNEFPQVSPSIPNDHLETAYSIGQKVSEALKGQSVLADNVNLLRKIVGHLMGDKRHMKIGWGELLKADTVSVKPDGRGSYELRKES